MAGAGTGARVRRRHAGRWAALMVAAALLAGCGEQGLTGSARELGADRPGVQLSGTYAGRQVAVTDGSPRVVVGNCEPARGPTTDVCFISHTIDGTLVVVALKNPDALQAGRTLPVDDPGCATPSECDSIDDVAIVDVQLGDGRRERATGGTLTVNEVQPMLRYAGSLQLQVGDGRITGTFDVAPTETD